MSPLKRRREEQGPAEENSDSVDFFNELPPLPDDPSQAPLEWNDRVEEAKRLKGGEGLDLSFLPAWSHDKIRAAGDSLGSLPMAYLCIQAAIIAKKERELVPVCNTRFCADGDVQYGFLPSAHVLDPGGTLLRLQGTKKSLKVSGITLGVGDNPADPRLKRRLDEQPRGVRKVMTATMMGIETEYIHLPHPWGVTLCPFQLRSLESLAPGV